MRDHGRTFRILTQPTTRIVAAMLASAVVMGVAGCKGERSAERPRRIFPDLDNQPKYQAQQKSYFFADAEETDSRGHARSFGRTQRPPVPGTVAFGRGALTDPIAGVDFARRASYLQEDLGVFEGSRYLRDRRGGIQYAEDGQPQTEYIQRMPIERILGIPASSPQFDPAFRELVALGRENFNIYCIVCHGANGYGDGMVGSRWAYPLPNWHDPQYQRGGEKGADGYLFHTLLYGLPNDGENPPYPFKMRGYMGKVTRHEAWAIVAYLRTLQAAHRGSLEDAPASDRQRLIDTRAQAIEDQQRAAGGGQEGAP